MAYSTVTDVRNITSLSTSDVTDAVIQALGTFTAFQLNRDLNTQVEREQILYIDDTRQNKIDGSNTTFYVKKWRKFIADSDYDQDVDTGDITVHEVQSDGTEGTVTVSSITPNDGQFVLSTAPSTGRRYYVTYEYANVSISDPHPLVTLAHAYLTASQTYSRISVGKYDKVRIGAISISLAMHSFKVYQDRYEETINKINNTMSDLVQTENIV